jgi:mono/diheme cytochrome c family protein
LSSRSVRTIRTSLLGVLFTLLLTGSLGCWEQWSNDWFPQMKWQPAVQAFESTLHRGRVEPFLPPEGTVPIDGGEAPMPLEDEAAADVLVNPQPMSLESLENGRQQFTRFCSTCHGLGGAGDGPVSMVGDIMGPLGGVLPLTGPASIARVRSDGHIYTTIRYGRRRMPSYNRIPSGDRWDVVNYIRYLNRQREVAR